MPCPECRNELAEGARFCPRCGAAAGAVAAPADPWIGETVNGKFRIEALLGQGGMGRVYRARHLTLDRPVVLKVLHAAYSDDPQIVQRFQREARAASRLNHPNSIAVLDFGAAEDGTLFMAMEYLAGRDLARVVAEEFPLGEARIVRIGAQILAALAEAHAQGIVHRDLKPENVMLEDRRGERDFVKVLDFGIAKITAPGANEPKLTQAGLVCGTPEYMSPEQARGADLDARSDLYSVGVILYQLATGDLPFASDTPVGYLTKHLAEQPVPPRARRPDLAISPALDALVTKAMEKDVARRFQNAEEMRAALLRAATATQVAGATDFAIDVAAPAPSRKGRAPVLAIGAGVVAVIVGVAVAVALGLGRKPAEQVPVAAAAIPTSTAAPTPTPASAPAPAPAPAPAEAPTPAPPPAVAEPAAPPPKPAPRSPRPARDARNPTKAKALFAQAESARAGQDVDEAIRLYLAALDADPRLAEAEKKLALCYQLKGETDLAAERYRRYLATDPPDAARVRAILGTLQ